MLITRFRHWPEEEFQYCLNYVGSRKPVVIFREDTHACRYPDDHNLAEWNEQKIADLVGPKRNRRHGHHGTQILTEVRPIEKMKDQ